MLVQVRLRYFDRNDRRECNGQVWVASQDLPKDVPDIKEIKRRAKTDPCPNYKKDILFKFRILPGEDLHTAEAAWCCQPGVLVADGIHKTTVGELKKRNIHA